LPLFFYGFFGGGWGGVDERRIPAFAGVTITFRDDGQIKKEGCFF